MSKANTSTATKKTATKATAAKSKGATGSGSQGARSANTGRTGASNTARANGAGADSNGAAGRSRVAPAGDRSKAPVEDSKLKEFFIDELKDIYWAEQKLVKTLPKLQKAATSEELAECFANHLEETKGQVQRLEQVFKLLGEKAVAKKCDAMEGITAEGSSVIEDTDDGTATRDVALIMAGQKAEHYEIATYGGLIQIANTLGHSDIADLLEQTLEEEKAADEKLTEIAENGINYEASEEEEEE